LKLKKQTDDRGLEIFYIATGHFNLEMNKNNKKSLETTVDSGIDPIAPIRFQTTRQTGYAARRRVTQQQTV
jgi:hypothetical protein